MIILHVTHTLKKLQGNIVKRTPCTSLVT
ncbi:hypothetical protein OESDEN_07931 [Oesophagostomum dentatum]|uniref:Uncharacterized protein n=1 Tax=Oesophagostomum dentatum TaxID=61180 RepID=A0A0B1T4P9_OESDE|nr:hypothetical protein OESDEN_07931 [Oesophagostomum dentatum]